MDQPPRKLPTLAQNIFAGMTLALTVLAMTLVGTWVDRKWNTSPWGVVVGSCIGIVGGLYNFIKEFANDSPNSTKGR